MEIIGLIAGKSEYPVLFAKAARSKGVRVIAVGIEGETKPEVEKVVDRFFWVRLGELSKVLEIFKSEGIKLSLIHI